MKGITDLANDLKVECRGIAATVLVLIIAVDVRSSSFGQFGYVIGVIGGYHSNKEIH